MCGNTYIGVLTLISYRISLNLLPQHINKYRRLYEPTHLNYSGKQLTTDTAGWMVNMLHP